MGNNPFIPEAVEHYLIDVITRESEVQKRLRRETQKMSQSRMQTSADQVAFLGMLVQMLGARQIIEVGTFTGYSALAMAMALPKDGRLIACDVSREWTDIAKSYWKDGGVDGRIDLRIAPAADTLAGLIAEGLSGKFDMAFIDADKKGYDIYYESCLKLLRAGGVIAFDNMLWSGAVADDSDQEENTVALRKLNLKIRDDSRVDACLLTIADGIMLARKR